MRESCVSLGKVQRRGAELAALQLVFILVSVLGCHAQSNPSVQPDELTFAQQVEAVRTGQSTKIHVEQEHITDDDMFQLSELDNLHILNLPNGRFTNAGLESLKQSSKLFLLRFGSPHVTDRGMAILRELKGLRFLHLIDVPITDDGLAEIQHMTWLESLYLDGGEFTEEGLEALLAELPVHFHRDQVHWQGEH